MSIENRMPKFLHASGVLCVLTRGLWGKNRRCKGTLPKYLHTPSQSNPKDSFISFYSKATPLILPKYRFFVKTGEKLPKIIKITHFFEI